MTGWLRDTDELWDSLDKNPAGEEGAEWDAGK